MTQNSPRNAFDDAKTSFQEVCQSLPHEAAIVESRAADRNALQDEFEKITGSIADVRTEIGKLETDIRDAEGALSASDLGPEERANWTQQLEQLKSHHTEENSKFEELSAKFERQSEGLGEENDKLDAAKSAFDSSKAALAGCIEIFFAEYDEFEAHVLAQLRDHLVDAEPDGGKSLEKTLETGKLTLWSEDGPIVKLADVKRIKLTSPELEYRISMLLDHLTARRIAEEMDTPTYLFRLKEFFNRAKMRARDIHHDIELWLARRTIDTQKCELDALNSRITFLIEQVPSQVMTQQVVDWHEKNQAIHTKFQETLDQIEIAHIGLADRLETFAATICSEKNIDRVGQISNKVSQAIEKGQFIRFLPFLSAALSAFLVKITLSVFSAPFLVQITTDLLVGVFVMAYLLSVVIGHRFRSATMKEVQDHQWTEATKLFAPNLEVSQNFRFEALELKDVSARSPHIRMTPQKPNLNPLIKMVIPNAGLVAAPTVVILAMAYVLSESGDWSEPRRSLAFQGTNEDGTSCTIEEGILTHSDGQNYYVLPAAHESASLGARFFPEFFADTIPRAEVIYISQTSRQTSRCDQILTRDPVVPKIIVSPIINIANEHDDAALVNCASIGSCPEVASNVIGKFEEISKEIETLKIVTSSLNNSQVKWQDAIALIDHPRGQMTSDPVFRNLITTLTEQLRDRDAQPPNVSTVFVPLPEIAVRQGQPEPNSAFWSYALYLDNSVAFEAANTLLLPFFPVDVSSTNNQPELAFKQGLDSFSSELSSPFSAGTSFYLARLTGVINKELSAIDGNLSLDISGFATARWKGVSNQNEKDLLNYALAEGRRFAVIQHLINEVSDENKKRIWVKSEAKNECRNLLEVQENRDQWTYTYFPAIEEPSKLEEARLAVNKRFDVFEQDAVADFLQRSVMIQLSQGRLACE